MEFELAQSIEILSSTPAVLSSYLSNLSEEWLKNNEGEGTWSPYTILGHLIEGERSDWMVRINTILGNSEDKLFEPFDRFAQLENDQNRPIALLLEEFSQLRTRNLAALRAQKITPNTLKLTGIHPEFGTVSLSQLIATWVVHDLGHIGQISRVMAKQYKEEVGPWINYLGILSK